MVKTRYGALVAAIFVGSSALAAPMTFEDILAMREINDVQLSPDDNAVAFVVKTARIEQDDYLYSILVKELNGKQAPITIAAAAGLSGIRWKPNSRQVSYLGEVDSQITLLDTLTQTKKNVSFGSLGKRVSIAGYEWSSDGTRLAVLLSRKAEISKEPFLNSHMMYGRAGNQPQLEAEYGVAVFSADGAPVCRSDAMQWSRANGVVWGPQGAVIAFADYTMDGQTGASHPNVVLMSAADCKPLRTIAERARPSFGATDEQLLTVVSRSSVRADGSFYFLASENVANSAIVRRDVVEEETLVSVEPPATSADPKMEIEALAWRAGEVIFEGSERSSAGLFRVRRGEPQRIVRSEHRLSKCSIAQRRNIAVCVTQSSMEPQELGLVNLRNGSVSVLTELNAAIKAADHGKVERIQVPNDRGQQVTMFLVYPTDYRAGQRYPTIVTMYGFNSGYISQAQYLTSYAPQTYASRGYFTLLWNYPMTTGGAAGDYAAQARDMQLGHFATTMHAVDQLIERGFADPAKIGIAGHSMGSLWMDYAITHSDRFIASSSHAPGGYTPSYYWQSGAMWRRRLDHIFGGPPAGDSLAAWQALSPPLLTPPKIPQIREVPDQEVLSELGYRYWVDTGAPVEMWVYPKETHVFSRPQGRLSSLRLNLDWFDFWLRGVEDSNPQKREQYQRWRSYRNNNTAASLSGSSADTGSQGLTP